MSLAADPRWQRFNDTSRPCPCCGRVFEGVFDIGFDHPQPWPHGNRVGKRAGRSDRLAPTRCPPISAVGAKYRFIRCVLHLPIQDSDQSFAFGPWSSVNKENFDRYVAAELEGTLDQFEGCFAWLMNALPGFEFDDWLPCNLLIDDPTQRPYLEVHDGSHALAELQESGITFDQLLDIYAAAGQDIRPHLLQS